MPFLKSVGDGCPIDRLSALDVRDTSEIDWKQLPDKDWNTFRSHKLREHWRVYLKRIQKSHPSFDVSDFRAVVQHLKSEVSNQSPSRRIVSKNVVDASDIDDNNEDSDSDDDDEESN
jgi:hypothetical protein